MPRVTLLREHECHRNLLRRCDDPYNVNFHKYGAKGATYVPRWANFANFYADMGPMPEGLSLDRIDNAGSYSPENCRWTTQATNNRNSGRVKLSQEAILHIRASAGKVPVSTLAQQYGVNRRTIWTAQTQRTWSNV